MLEKHPDYELINVDKVGIGANPVNLHDTENEDATRSSRAISAIRS